VKGEIGGEFDCMLRSCRVATAPPASANGQQMRADRWLVRIEQVPRIVRMRLSLERKEPCIELERMRECVEDLDSILSVKGVDMVQFGPRIIP